VLVMEQRVQGQPQPEPPQPATLPTILHFLLLKAIKAIKVPTDRISLFNLKKLS